MFVGDEVLLEVSFAVACERVLTPTGEHVTLLSMAGSYRPPLGRLGQALDQAILHRVAAATIRGFVAQVAARIGGRSGGATETPAPNGPAPRRLLTKVRTSSRPGGPGLCRRPALRP